MWFFEVMLYTQFTWFFFHLFLESEEGTIFVWNDLLLSAEDSKVYEQMNEYRFLFFFFSFFFRPKRKQDHIHCIITCDPFRPSLGGGVHQTEHIILALRYKRWQTNRPDETRRDVWCGSRTGGVWGESGVVVVRTMKYKLANMHYLFSPYKKCGSVKQI